MSVPDYELFPLYGYDVAGEPSGPVDPGPPMAPSQLQVNGQPAGYNLPADYTGPLLVGSPGGGPAVVLTDPADIAQYRDDARERVLEGVAQVGSIIAAPLIGAAIAAGMAPSGSPSQLTWQDPQVNFPRTDRIYIPGTEPPPPNRLPVPYEPPPQPGPFAFGIGGIGAILGGVIAGMWEGWPNALDPELGPYDTRAPSASPNDETPAEGPEFGPPSQQQVPGDYVDNPMPPGFPDFGGGPSQDPLPEEIDLGPVPDVGPPQGARQPAPAPAAPPSPGLPPWVWPLIGAVGAVQLGRAGRSRSSMTLPEISVLPSPGLTVDDLTALIEPLLGSAASSVTNVTNLTQAGGGGVWDTGGGQDTCNCSPRRGKKRKCRARAQLSWRSGPKKGKPAGSRCYSFED